MKAGSPFVVLAALLGAAALVGGFAWFQADAALRDARTALTEATTTVATLESTLAENENEN